MCGDTVADLRIPHKGDVIGKVIAGAYDVLDGFELVRERREGMAAITLEHGESEVFARAALSLKYDDPVKPPPITEAQLLQPRRLGDDRPDLWSTFNRVQENLVQGGLSARTTNGRRSHTRAIQGIDQNVKVNRALWILAEEMKRLKG